MGNIIKAIEAGVPKEDINRGEVMRPEQYVFEEGELKKFQANDLMRLHYAQGIGLDLMKGGQIVKQVIILLRQPSITLRELFRNTF